MFVCKSLETAALACSQLSPYLLCRAEALQAGALATPPSQAPQQDTKCVCISLNTRTVQAQCHHVVTVSAARRHVRTHNQLVLV